MEREAFRRAADARLKPSRSEDLKSAVVAKLMALMGSTDRQRPCASA